MTRSCKFDEHQFRTGNVSELNFIGRPENLRIQHIPRLGERMQEFVVNLKKKNQKRQR